MFLKNQETFCIQKTLICGSNDKKPYRQILNPLTRFVDIYYEIVPIKTFLEVIFKKLEYFER